MAYVLTPFKMACDTTPLYNRMGRVTLCSLFENKNPSAKVAHDVLLKSYTLCKDALRNATETKL